MNRLHYLSALVALAAVAVCWSCAEVKVEGQNAGDCEDGADNDMDGTFDCGDDGCSGAPVCVGDDDDTSVGGDDDTSTGGDDDTGGPGDDDTGGPGDDDSQGGGTGEGSSPECQPDVCPECEDGADNDGDGLMDCDDPGCSDWCNGAGDDDTGGPGDDDSQGGGGMGEGDGQFCTSGACPECEDGLDNDADGTYDCGEVPDPTSTDPANPNYPADPGCSDWCNSRS